MIFVVEVRNITGIGDVVITKEDGLDGRVVRISGAFPERWTFDLNDITYSPMDGDKGEVQIEGFELDRPEGLVVLARFTEGRTKSQFYFKPTELKPN